MGHDILLWIILAVIAADFIIEQTLLYINIRHQPNEMPASLGGIYDGSMYQKSRDYYREKSWFSIITASFTTIITIIIFYFGLPGILDTLLRILISNTIMEALVFFAIGFLFFDILSVPFQIYETFVIEARYGFNKTTPAIFIGDKFKGYLLGGIIGGILLSVFIFLIDSIGVNFWLIFWIVFSLFMLFINMFYTTLIVPLFNKLTPLPDGELKSAIEEYSQKVGFPLDNIFVMDGSKRSSKANAFFSGIGKKKTIVLFDTLINNHTTEELVAVLAHEVGHYKKKHVIIQYILSVIQAGIMFYILSFFVSSEPLSLALGGEEPSLPLNLTAFAILFTPISMITGIIFHVISRRNEYEADAYAATTYDPAPLIAALRRLSVNNLSNLTPHPLYVFVHYSHPPVLARLTALDNIRNEMNAD